MGTKLMNELLSGDQASECVGSNPYAPAHVPVDGN